MAEMPHLVQVQEQYGESSFRVVGVTQATVLEAEKFMAEQALNFSLLAGTEENAESFGVKMIWGSVFYLVDPEGQIVAGSLKSAERVLEEQFEGAAPH